MTDTLLRATRYLSNAQAAVRGLTASLAVCQRDLAGTRPGNLRLHYLVERARLQRDLDSARANVVARRHEVERLEAETGDAR